MEGWGGGGAEEIEGWGEGGEDAVGGGGLEVGDVTTCLTLSPYKRAMLPLNNKKFSAPFCLWPVFLFLKQFLSLS